MSEKTRCSVCNHARSGEIASALLAGEPQRTVAERFGLAKSSLSRHMARHTFGQALERQRKVLVPKRKRRKDSTDSIDVTVLLRELINEVRDLSASEKDRGRSNSVAQLSAVLLRGLELLEKREDKAREKASRGKAVNPFESMSPEALMALRDALNAKN